jgi:uncharacterized protein (TIGR03067 family)
MQHAQRKFIATCSVAVILLGGLGSVFLLQTKSHGQQPKQNPSVEKQPVPKESSKPKPTVPAKTPTDAKDLESLQGKWLHVVSTTGTHQITGAPLEGKWWEFSGQSVRMSEDPTNNLERWSITIDATKTPKQIDFIPNVPAGLTPNPIRGIYELKANELTICLGSDRPTDFIPDLRGKNRLIVFKRAQPISELLTRRTPEKRVNYDDELARFAGDWIIRRSIVAGEEAVPNGMGLDREIELQRGLSFAGSTITRFRMKEGEPLGREDGMVFAIDATTNPPQINFTTLDTPGSKKGFLQPGIFEFKDGGLWICIGPEGLSDRNRPTEFLSTFENRHTLYVLERVSVKPKE